MAFEDAATLAKALRDYDSPAEALGAYDMMRRDRVRAIVEYGSRNSNDKKPGRLGRIVRDMVLPAILKRGATPEAIQKDAWVFESHIDWDTRLG